MNDEEFLTQFERCQLENWNHTSFIRVIWIYLKRFEFEKALSDIRLGMQDYFYDKGFDIYNETAIVAYAHEVASRMTNAVDEFKEFADFNSDLINNESYITSKYYKSSTLENEFAKRKFVPPDKMKLPTIEKKRL